MFILTRRKPLPLVSQSEIEAERVQAGIRVAKTGETRLLSPGVRVEQRLLEVESRVRQPSGNDEPLGLRELVSGGQKPAQQVEGSCEDDHLFGHGVCLHY